jgi:hypothetical protein
MILKFSTSINSLFFKILPACSTTNPPIVSASPFKFSNTSPSIPKTLYKSFSEVLPSKIKVDGSTF